jgi:hypothetical protein
MVKEVQRRPRRVGRLRVRPNEVEEAQWMSKVGGGGALHDSGNCSLLSLFLAKGGEQ